MIWVAVLLCMLLVMTVAGRARAEKAGGSGRKNWDCETIEHAGFKDLGNYVIELPDYTDPDALKRGIAAFNAMADHGEMLSFGCTAMAKRNSKGEVVMGRNMDLDISQSPAYVYRSTFGKYKNFCVAYAPNFYKNYAEIQQLDALDQNVQDMLLAIGCDCLNEKGLYIEMNLRERNDKLACFGLHSAQGEKTRDDGTPWRELRACSVSIPQLVSQNCATVAEAVEYLKNSYDWYTVATPPGVNLGVNNSNMCFMIGDATGEYGLVEIAQDDVSYIPYQYGQANFYITPEWNAMDTFAVGHGRLAMVSQVIKSVETMEDAMTAMEKIMWRNETLWVGESHRVTDGTRLHPYNQIRFEDNKGEPQMDWRSDYIFMWPVMDDGRMIVSIEVYEEVKKAAAYDPKVKQYVDEAVATGRMVIDDGTYKFFANGQILSLVELYDKYSQYEASVDQEERRALKPYHDEYYRLLENHNRVWVHDDYNFEAMKAAAYASLHIRYDMEGRFDPTVMSKYEKLCAFYGMGVEKDEKPLRDDGQIWTTSLNIGVNCAEKKIKVRFWENDGLIYEYGF